MYVRCQKLKGKYRRAVLIGHSVRNGKKIIQKTVKYFGIAHNEEELTALRKIAELELRRIKSNQPELEGFPIAYEKMQEESRIIEGPHDIFGAMFDRFNLGSILSRLRHRQLRDVVVARIAMPASKCRTADLLSRHYARTLSEDQIYRLMDQLTPHASVIQNRIFETTRQLAPQQTIELLFFDVTTLYFESQRADELRDIGYSKDHKIGEVQVVLALATTSDGLPIGYTLFSGKTAEVKTLLHCLHEWRQTIDIGNAVVIADRAMMSEANLCSMEQEKIRYVVAAKLKQMPAALKRKILARQEEALSTLGTEPIWTQEYAVEGRRLIVSYSESRAIKDREDRKRLVSRLQQKIQGDANPRKLITNRGYLKFLDDKSKGKVSINEEKIAQDSRWDGLHGIITNDMVTSREELLNRYRQLWIIEESFRINKHTLAMRPIYHHKPERVRIHVLICYLAFAISRFTQYQLKSYGLTMSVDAIRQALLEVEASNIRVADQFYKVPSAMSSTAEAIYRAMGVRRSSYAAKIQDRRSKCSGTQKMQVVGV